MKPVRLLATSFVALPGLAMAAGIALLDAPNIVEGGLSVRPNLYFILDNSGSMDWDFLPDWVTRDNSYCKGTNGKALGTSTQGSTGTSNMHCCLSSSGSDVSSDCLGNNNYGLPPFLSSDFNNIYYNPAITYARPRNHDGSEMDAGIVSGATKKDGYNIQNTGTLNLSTSFPDIKWCTDSGASDCLRNGNYLLPGTVNNKYYGTMVTATATGSGNIAKTTTTTENRSFGPHYYVIVPGAYCTTKKLTSCTNQNGPTTTNPFPAKLRWCNTSDLTTADIPGTVGLIEGCQALKTNTYKYPLYPSVALISGGSASATVTIDSVNNGAGFTVRTLLVAGTLDLLPIDRVCGDNVNGCDTSTNNATTRRNRVRDAIINSINAGGTGFSASANGDGTIKIDAPPGSTTYNGATLAITNPAPPVGVSWTVGNFNNAGGVPVLAPGSWHRVDITSGTYGNLYVDTTTGAVTTVSGANTAPLLDRSGRTDCTAGSCTAAQELQNYANWFSWYRTRMQMMKSSVSLAFQGIDEKVRVGYFTINNPDLVSTANGINIKNFDATHKQNWYTNFLKANPSGGTPLREALSRAGRLYAGTLSAVTDAKDPVQYSCQKNFTILSTDGYWNGNAGVNLSGSTLTTDVDSDGTANTLADVAAYYYQQDLRTSSCLNAAANNLDGVNYDGLCTNDVPTNADDNNSKQHMVTSTIGLGIDGVMQYRGNYHQSPSPEDLPDDYSTVQAGTPANQSIGVCSWQSSGNCKWPIPGSDKQENIDDLWHAAVNGHGTYYSARTPNELREGLEDLLAKINANTGGAAAATTSNPNITTGDNFVFSSSFRTVEWYGELVRQEIDTSTGAILPAIDWSLQANMDAAGLRSTVYTWSDAAGNHRKDFTYANLNSTNESVCSPPADEKGCFNAPLISAWQQWGGLSATDRTLAAKTELVEYLRGDQSNEGTLYRDRTHTLGDIVSAEAVFVGRYVYEYSNGYPGRGTLRADPTVYVAANDGMLHAINANTGQPRWSYVPSMVLPNLHRLADKGYDLSHRFFVDGTPVVGDVESGGWRTILVGGLAGGGQGYYAMDITSQTSPTILWEMRKRPAAQCATDPGPQLVSGVLLDCDIGYSYGNPVISKVNGTWVVMLTSGYNNHTDGGDGGGYLYVLNAITGAPLLKIPTGAGNTTTPSGLAKIAAWADNATTQNIVQYVYGGDYLGNLWRFDVVNGGATLLRAFGNTQPITAKPELGLITGAGLSKRVVFVPTGSLVAAGDLSTSDQQSFYGIWDAALDGMSPTTIVPHSISGTGNRTSTTCDSVFEDNTKLGWKIDFGSRERGTTDPTLAFGTLVFSTNAPSSTSVCNPSGFESWVYNVDYKCGGVVQVEGEDNTMLATHYDGASTRPNVIVLPSGVVKSITRVSGQSLDNKVAEVRINETAGGLRRITWRELFD